MADVAMQMAEMKVGATLVGAVMTTNLTTVSEDATLEEAIGVDALPQLPSPSGEVRQTGLLSMPDLMNFELEQKTEELHHMRQQYIHGSS